MPRPEPLPYTRRETRPAERPLETSLAAAASAWLEFERRWIAEPRDEEEDAPLDDGVVEPPCRESQLEAYDAMLLNSLLMQQASAGRFTAAPPDVGQCNGQTRPLYDWFVNALNVAPLCDALLGFVERLAAWNQSARRAHRPARSRKNSTADSSPDRPTPRELRV